MKTDETAGTTGIRICKLAFCRRCSSITRVLRIGRRLAGAALFLVILLSLNAFAANEETFATLRVGDHTYQNVRVTTKGKNFIIIAHSGGITSVKVSELPANVLEKLGYAPPPAPKKHIKSAPMWAGLAIPKTDAALIKPIEAKLSQIWQRVGLASKVQLLKLTRSQVLLGIVILLMAYLFYSYCSLLICQKAGHQPGVWVLLPLVQAFPMLQAASMSAWWFAALFIPGLNLFAYALWCVKIVQARRKTVLLAILLIFPLTTWIAFVFLAFSGGTSKQKNERYIGITTPQPRDFATV